MTGARGVFGLALGLGLLVGVLVGIAVSEGTGSIPYYMAYKDGQVDYAAGKVKWILVKQADGSTQWKEKKTD
jgi:hypothetical protein